MVQRVQLAPGVRDAGKHRPPRQVPSRLACRSGSPAPASPARQSVAASGERSPDPCWLSQPLRTVRPVCSSRTPQSCGSPPSGAKPSKLREQPGLGGAGTQPGELLAFETDPPGQVLLMIQVAHFRLADRHVAGQAQHESQRTAAAAPAAPSRAGQSRRSRRRHQRGARCCQATDLSHAACQAHATLGQCFGRCATRSMPGSVKRVLGATLGSPAQSGRRHTTHRLSIRRCTPSADHCRLGEGFSWRAPLVRNRVPSAPSRQANSEFRAIANGV